MTSFARLFLLLLFLPSASAQQKYVPIQVGSKPGAPPPPACVDTYRIIKSLISSYPHPDSWTWIMACDDRTWTSLLQHLGQDTAGKYTFALTDQKNHITYVRVQGILNPTDGAASRPEHVLAHELAHIYLHSSDERQVDEQATAWIKVARKEKAAIQIAGVQ
jgi:hypothetical protein